MTEDAPTAVPQPPTGGPPAPSVAFFLLNLGRSTREAVDAGLSAHGLSFPHLSVLGHLQRQPGLSYSELARRAGVTVQSMQATVGALQSRGLVDPGPRAGQGRRAELTVTEPGRQLLATGLAAMRAVDDDLLAGFSPAERASLEAALLRLFRTRAETAQGPKVTRSAGSGPLVGQG